MPDNNPPTEEVLRMKKDGLDDTRIRRELEKKGYSFQQISEAFNQANIKSGVEEGMQVSALNKASEEEEESFVPVPTPQAASPQPETEGASPTQYQQPAREIGGEAVQRAQPYQQAPLVGNIQALVEEIVEEKWSEISVGVGDINIWKVKMVDDLESVKQELIRMQNRFENLQGAVLGKVREYSEDIKDLGAEMKALEKVFEKIIEPLTTNVKELSRITEDLKVKRPGVKFD